MDVLAGRKTGGTITGEMRIKGFPWEQRTFARVTGYVEQAGCKRKPCTRFCMPGQRGFHFLPFGPCLRSTSPPGRPAPGGCTLGRGRGSACD
jgi:hypothetical protein